MTCGIAELSPQLRIIDQNHERRTQGANVVRRHKQPSRHK